MDNLMCERCGHIAPTKQRYESHLKKKNPCQPKEEKTNYCQICNKHIPRNDNFLRHQKSIKHMNNLSKANSIISQSSNNKIINSNNVTNNNVSIAPTNICGDINTQSNNPMFFFTPQKSLNPKNEYTYNNIDELTLLEQFYCLIYEGAGTPYCNLLDLYNFNADKPNNHNISSKLQYGVPAPS